MSYKTPYKKPRSKRDMTAYLDLHPRYDTANSCNAATSYARCVKVHHIAFADTATRDTAYDVVGSDGDWRGQCGVSTQLHEFGERHDYRWQINPNGRSDGYLVLYQSERKPSGYKSFCAGCGQLSYTAATDDNKRCGNCGRESRKNFSSPHTELVCWPFRGTDTHEDFTTWSREALCARVGVVWDFDKTVDRCIKLFVEYCRGVDVVEKTTLVPRKTRVAVPKKKEAVQ